MKNIKILGLIATLLDVEKEIGLKEVPAAVLTQLKKEFKSYEIEKVEKISKDNLTYHELLIEVSKNKQENVYKLL